MTRITVDVSLRNLTLAQDVLGTHTKVATINEALRLIAVRAEAAEIVAAFDSVPMDFADSAQGWRYGGGRELSDLEHREAADVVEQPAPDPVLA